MFLFKLLKYFSTYENVTKILKCNEILARGEWNFLVNKTKEPNMSFVGLNSLSNPVCCLGFQSTIIRKAKLPILNISSSHIPLLVFVTLVLRVFLQHDSITTLLKSDVVDLI